MSNRLGLSPPPLTLAKKRRARQHRSNREEQVKVVLENILGLTCLNSNGLTVCGATGCFAYPAGSVTVLYLPKRSRQLHILNTSRKPISCVCLSPDGKFLATGESGHQPCVRVWDISSTATPPVQVTELKGHSHGITCIAFSPNMKYLVSVGYQHDQNVYLWNWKAATSLATNKIAFQVYGVAFSEGGSYFVTVGNRRVRFWYLDMTSRSSQASPLKGRSAILGQLQHNCFISVACGRGPLAENTYTLTKTGLLCLFDSQRRLDRFTEVKASPAHCLTISEQYLFCGCSEAVIRLFDPYTLDYLVTLPKPHSLGVNIAASLDPSQFSVSSGEGEERYPDTTALALDDTNKRLTAVYNDHSLYVWDLRNIKQIGKTHSFLYHGTCVWDVCVYPQLSDKTKGLLPELCFVTCSSDNTVRFWCRESGQEDSGFIRNIYSKELMRIIYTDSDVNCLKDFSKTPGDASAVADTKRGVRCIQFHPGGQHLAVGDRAGNVRVYDLQFMDQIFEAEAHDSEVLCIEYSPKFNDLQFMVTASRDRLIHIFTTNGSYEHLQTLDDHASSITSVKFTVRDSLNLLSCGADKSIMFRTLETSPEIAFQRSNHIVGKATIYDMDVDTAGKLMATAGQDKILRIYHTATGRQKSVIKPPTSEAGSLLRVSVDPSGLYVATSSSDKAVSLFDFYSGECLARLYGHSEVVTQIRFSRDCKYLYSVSGDSCVFVWRLSRELTQTMHDRLAEMGRPVSPSVELTPARTLPEEGSRRDTYSVPAVETQHGKGANQTDTGEDEDPMGFRLSVSQLPAWAQRKVIERPSIARSISARELQRPGQRREGGTKQVEEGSSSSSGAQGRWAQRASEGDIVFASDDQEALQSSDAELEELSAEMTRVVTEQDLEVFDLTEEDEPDGLTVGHVTVRGEERGWEGEKAEDEEEIIYPTLQPGVDPSSFTVTTPEKLPRSFVVSSEDPPLEEEASGSSGGSTPEVSPKTEKKEGFPFQAGEEVDFLKVNFESLSSTEVDKIFVPQPIDTFDPRLSISAKFLSQSLRKDVAKAFSSCPIIAGGASFASIPDAAGASPELPKPSTSPGKDPTLVLTGGSQSSRLSEKEDCQDGGSEANTGEEVPTQPKAPKGSRPYVEAGEREEEEKVAHRPVTRSQASKKQGGSMKDEVVKVRKRLEELGYAVPSKEPVQTKRLDTATKPGLAPEETTPVPTHKSASVKPRRVLGVPPQDPPQPLVGPLTQERPKSSTLQAKPQQVGSEQTMREMDGARAEQADCDGAPGSRLSHLNALILSMNEIFREVVAIHGEAVQGLSQEQEAPEDCEELIATVATAVNALKIQTTTLSNKNRKKWRGKDSSNRYSLRATPTSGASMTPILEATQTDSHSSLSANDAKLPKDSSVSSASDHEGTLPRPSESQFPISTAMPIGSVDTVQLLTDPRTVEVLRKLLKHSEELTSAQSAQGESSRP